MVLIWRLLWLLSFIALLNNPYASFFTRIYYVLSSKLLFINSVKEILKIKLILIIRIDIIFIYIINLVVLKKYKFYWQNLAAQNYMKQAKEYILLGTWSRLQHVPSAWTSQRYMLLQFIFINKELMIIIIQKIDCQL